MSRAKIAEEVRQEFLQQVKAIVQYWVKLPYQSVEDKCDGVAFSILNIFDGNSVALPAIDLVLCPHPDDMEYHQDNGEDWYKSGMVINNCQLHELYCQIKEEKS